MFAASCSSRQRFASGFLPTLGHPRPLPSANTCPCRLCRGLSPPSGCALAGGTKKRAESAWTPPFPLERFYVRTKVIRMATASERPSAGLGRARDNEPARITLWPTGQHEIPTNDEPRYQPVRPETRPNQRLYVSFGSPPLVAMGSSPARAAHRSRAPKNVIPSIPLLATRVKFSRNDANSNSDCRRDLAISLRPSAGFCLWARRKAPSMVGATGLEPATFWSQTRRSTKLSYAPKIVPAASTHTPKGSVRVPANRRPAKGRPRRAPILPWPRSAPTARYPSGGGSGASPLVPRTVQVQGIGGFGILRILGYPMRQVVNV